MKKYKEVFTCELPVQLLADKLMKVMTNHLSVPADADAKGGSEQSIALYEADVDYFTTVVESIVDSIKDNGTACAHVFNTLNGWVKTETPSDRKDIEAVQDVEATGQDQPTDVDGITFGMSVSFYLPLEAYKTHNVNDDWMCTRKWSVVGSIEELGVETSTIRIYIINLDGEGEYISYNILTKRLNQVSDVSLSGYNIEVDTFIKEYY